MYFGYPSESKRGQRTIALRATCLIPPQCPPPSTPPPSPVGRGNLLAPGANEHVRRVSCRRLPSDTGVGGGRGRVCVRVCAWGPQRYGRAKGSLPCEDPMCVREALGDWYRDGVGTVTCSNPPRRLGR